MRSTAPPSEQPTLDAEEFYPLEETSAVRPALTTDLIANRYQDRGLLARGAMGEIRRVYDCRLRRAVAMKLLSWELLDDCGARMRFANEIAITAGLQHPGIVAVHDCGEIDRRPWFTMKEIAGITLEAAVRRLPAGDRYRPELMRLIEAFRRICEAVAYAHSRRIIHRDLKPANLMLGEFGEVLVMDWGVAKRAGKDSGSIRDEAPASGQLTRYGDVVGTPHFMAPEQASGGVVDERSDVYALGAVLRFILVGRAPYAGSAREALARLRAGPPPPIDLSLPAGRLAPEGLIRICERAMHRDPDDRFPDAAALERALEDWIEGARRRSEAVAVMARAEEQEAVIAALRERSAAERASADALREEAVAAPAAMEGEISDAKRRLWRHEDRAEAIERDVVLAEVRWLELVRNALEHDPDLAEAHARLADYYARELVAAERAHDGHAVARSEALLRKHDRGRHARLLSASGAVTVVTDPPGAEVIARRYQTVDRRLVPGEAVHLGTTPLFERALPKGSYELTLRAPGRPDVTYPVLIERSGHWDGIPPGESEPQPVVLPRADAIPPGMIYVPAGWFWCGGDPRAVESLPAKRIWVDGFLAGRFPVTSAEYLAYLNALVAEGREEDALRDAPCQPMGLPLSDERNVMLSRSADGFFGLAADEQGLPWHPDQPIVMIDWFAARRFIGWRSRREGRAFRLLSEIEWEKMARGVDGRICAWGNAFEPSWACLPRPKEGPLHRASVHAFPYDESPYGARGVMGNVRDWCAEVWRSGGPFSGQRLAAGETIDPADGVPGDSQRVARGGSFTSVEDASHPAARFAALPHLRYATLGFRVGMPITSSSLPRSTTADSPRRSGPRP